MMQDESGSRPDARLVTLVNTNQIKPAVAPIAFDYLHGPLVRAGFEVEFLDLCFSEDFEADIRRYCEVRRPRFWGVTVRNTDDTYFASQQSFLPLAHRMVSALKSACDVPVIMGGVGFSIMPERILERCGAEFGIICEGEVSFPRLLDRLVRDAPYDDIPGLVYRTPEGFRRNPVELADLSLIEPHSRSLITNERYFAKGGQAGIETKRGCNRVCIYCVEPLVKARQVRLRPPEHIVTEMEALVRRGIDVFHINDSEFNLDIPHALAFCREIRARGLASRVRWYAYGMPAPFPDELAASMKAAGCVGMNFGTDSASETMLRILRRTFRPPHIAQAVETCHRHGLAYMLELLLGAPGETAETVAETIGFLKRIGAERVLVTLGLRVFPGTELERMVRAEGISRQNPNLHGAVEGNDGLAEPLFYISSKIGPDPVKTVSDLIAGDSRFFSVNSQALNYNANQILVDAIECGHRGAYWDILVEVAKSRADLGGLSGMGEAGGG